MELIKVHANGQWELVHKANEFAGEKDNDYLSYRQSTAEGKLPEDHGQRGVLHNVGTVRAPRTLSEHKLKGKVPNPIESAAAERNPGMGLE